MRFLYIRLVHHGVVHRGIDLGMAEELLHLLHGHTFVDGDGGEGAAEFVGMDTGDFQTAPQLAQADLFPDLMMLFELPESSLLHAYPPHE